jgi:hypothetical protein
MAASFAELRDELHTTLRAALGEDWHVAEETPLDELATPTIWMQRTGIRKAAQQGWLTNEFSVFVVFPAGTSENVIDDSVETALQALDDAGYGAAWSAANRIIFGTNSPGWSFDFSAQSTRKPQPTN